MKTICPARSSGHSRGSGSLTFTIRSARFQMSAALATISAPLRGVVLVGDAAALPGPGLDQHRVAGPRQLLDADRDHGHAVFVAS